MGGPPLLDKMDIMESLAPLKLCRTNGCVSDIRTCLGNMPEVVLTQNFWVHIVPFLQNSCFSVQKVLIISDRVEYKSMLSRHISYPKVLGQNHFWHVPQTYTDVRNASICPARFLGVDQALGTCVFAE